MLNLNRVQTRDIGKIISTQIKIRQRLQKKQPVEQMQSRLQQLVTASTDKTDSIASSWGDITLQSDLPIAEKEQEVLDLLRQNQVIIVAGETGCGKTTQLPKLCLKAGLGARGLIAHTQPRRVAATSVARRIAEELDTPLGGLVGYSIRFNKQQSESTRIKLMTDGVLLSEIETDPLLSRYEVIIIDEAHERSLNIDFLLGFLKNILQKRKDLKLIITSATIDPEKFSANFNQAPILLIEGRSYPVEVRYRPLTESSDKQSDILMNGIISAVDECCTESTGNILIFADGEGQIKSIVKKLSGLNIANTQVLALYARLSMNDQQKIFAVGQKRKIIVSTNVAETSLTVPGIIFVIDIGTARISRFSQRNKIQQLPIEKISRASAEQRKGRCGRIAPGICIRLYSEEDYLLREDFTSAEISRTNLSSVVLRLKAMRVKQVDEFPFIEPPQERAWNTAFNHLIELTALNDKQQITQIGKNMARIPVDPQLARILVDTKLQALNEMLVFCALMSVKEVRERPHEKQQKADQLHQKYIQNNSDVLTAISLWNMLSNRKDELTSSGFKKWCQENMINFLGVLEWRRMYFQLKESVESQGKKINTTAASFDEVHKALIPGFITHLFCKTQEAHYQGVRGLKIWLHPSSLSFKHKKNWLLSAELIETEKLYARMNAEIKPEWVEEAASHLLKNHYQDVHWSKKKGQVVAALNQTLLGLPIVNNRIINYSKVEPELCREKFILDGLAAGQLTENFPFLSRNRAKIAELEKQEQKQRLNNIRIDMQSLACLYQQVVPESVVTQAALKKWLKQDFNKHNQLLSFTKLQLTANKVDNADAYPSELIIKGFSLKLSYCFAPGTEADGVSVDIPTNMVSQFNDRDFDWLVPGYLEEKILATIKVLPKTIRRSLIPVSTTAQQCTQALQKIDQQGKRFIDELANVLQRISGIHIKIGDFDMESLPAHLKMKYRVLDKNTVRQITSLVEFRIEKSTVHGGHSVSSLSSAIKSWPEADFKLEKTVTNNNITSRIFQGFHDQQGKVVIKPFSSKKAAEQGHIRGLARLILTACQSELNQFFNSWPDKIQLEKLSIRLGGFKLLFDSLALMVAVSFVDEQFTKDKHSITAESNYLKLKDKFKSGFRQLLSVQLNNILPLIRSREQLFVLVAELKEGVYDESIEDIRAQLKALWSPINMQNAGDSLLDNYKRYQKGLLVRLERIKTNYPKEQSSMETWKDWLEWWDDLVQANARELQQSMSAQLFWMLQEFRLSLFSPGVKVIGGISAKKLQKQFERLESLLSTE